MRNSKPKLIREELHIRYGAEAARLYKHMTEYDFIIVGGGTAGCVLANRLSADTHMSLLLLEDGLPGWNPIIHIPAAGGRAGKLKTLMIGPPWKIRATSIRNEAFGGNHLAGPCKMGQDAMAVVTPDLKVRGIEGLRVIDASILPTLISAHTYAAAFVIGERRADLLLGGAQR